jgi:hypothetical protein
MDKVAKLRRLGEIINGKGNSHNPEYWEAGDKIEYAADHIQADSDWDLVDQVKQSLDTAMNTEETRVTKPAHETIVAVLTGEADGMCCNGCGEPKQMDTDGYCFSCREVYDRKP